MVLTDEGGNTNEDTVRFTILPEGSEVPDQDGDEDSDPEGATACSVDARDSTPSPLVVWAPLFLLAGWRRRR